MIIEPGADSLSMPLPATKKATQQAQAGAGVGLEQEVDRVAGLLGRSATPSGRQHAVVEGVVQEQDLGGLDDDGGQGQHAVLDQDVDDGAGARC